MTARIAPYAALGVLLALLAAFGVGQHRGAASERARWELQQARTERALFERLAARTREVAAITAAQVEAQHAAEVRHARLQTEIDRARADLARVVRLRDPGARAAGGCALPAAAADPGAAIGHDPAGADLSAAADGFLRQFAADADAAALYAVTCRRWVEQVQGARFKGQGNQP